MFCNHSRLLLALLLAAFALTDSAKASGAHAHGEVTTLVWVNYEPQEQLEVTKGHLAGDYHSYRYPKELTWVDGAYDDFLEDDGFYSYVAQNYAYADIPAGSAHQDAFASQGFGTDPVTLLSFTNRSECAIDLFFSVSMNYHSSYYTTGPRSEVILGSSWDFSAEGPDGLLFRHALNTSIFESRAWHEHVLVTLQPGQWVQFKQNKMQNFLQVYASTIPEPRSWAMLLTGFAGIGFVLRRRERIAHNESA